MYNNSGQSASFFTIYSTPISPTQPDPAQSLCPKLIQEKKSLAQYWPVKEVY